MRNSGTVWKPDGVNRHCNQQQHNSTFRKHESETFVRAAFGNSGGFSSAGWRVENIVARLGACSFDDRTGVLHPPPGEPEARNWFRGGLVLPDQGIHSRKPVG